MSGMVSEIERTIQYFQAFRNYQDESAQNLMAIAESSARQLVALHICLDVAYRARSELTHSESAKDLVEAIEEIVITNREIAERITKATLTMRALVERLEKIERAQ